MKKADHRGGTCNSDPNTWAEAEANCAGTRARGKKASQVSEKAEKKIKVPDSTSDYAFVKKTLCSIRQLSRMSQNPWNGASNLIT
jgi:hypothetical protein